MQTEWSPECSSTARFGRRSTMRSASIASMAFFIGVLVGAGILLFACGLSRRETPPEQSLAVSLRPAAPVGGTELRLLPINIKVVFGDPSFQREHMENVGGTVEWICHRTNPNIIARFKGKDAESIHYCEFVAGKRGGNRNAAVRVAANFAASLFNARSDADDLLRQWTLEQTLPFAFIVGRTVVRASEDDGVLCVKIE